MFAYKDHDDNKNILLKCDKDKFANTLEEIGGVWNNENNGWLIPKDNKYMIENLSTLLNFKKSLSQNNENLHIKKNKENLQKMIVQEDDNEIIIENISVPENKLKTKDIFDDDDDDDDENFILAEKLQNLKNKILELNNF